MNLYAIFLGGAPTSICQFLSVCTSVCPFVCLSVHHLILIFGTRM